MSKRILSVFLAALLVFGCVSSIGIVASAASIIEEKFDMDEGDRVDRWVFFSDGLLEIYDYEDMGWKKYSADVLNVVLKEGISSIPANAFYGFEKLETVTSESSIGLIGEYAFNECPALKSVSSTKTVSTIGSYAFYKCTSLESFDLGRSFDCLENVNIFKGCTSLKTVTAKNGCTSIGYGMFEDCSALETIVLPDSIEKIGKHAFEDCVSLQNIIIPDSTTEVGDYAFYNCAALKTASLGHNANTLGSHIFANCTSLEEVTLSTSIEQIAPWMFYGCSSLSTINNMTVGISTISENAFAKCSSLASITIPDTVTSIGKSAFDSTAIATIDIPSGVVSIGDGAFTNCTNLTDINVSTKNSAYRSVDGALYTVGLETLLVCPQGKTGDYEVNENTTDIADAAFLGCDKIDTVAIPNSVDTIANTAFNDCSADLTIKCNCDSYAAKYAVKYGIKTDITHVLDTEYTIDKEATCTDDGSKSIHCSACGAKFDEEVIESPGHNFSKVWTVDVAATCTTVGIKSHHCTRCDAVQDETEIPEEPHSFGDWTVKTEATCLDDGLRESVCSECKCIIEEVIPATGHEYSDEWTVDVPATRTTEGVKSHHCIHCGDKTDETAIPKLLPGKVVLGSISASEAGIQISWTAEKDAETYVIYRKSAGGSYAVLASADKSDLSYTDTSVSAGEAYTYTVAASNENGEGKYDETGLTAAYLTKSTLKISGSLKGVVLSWSAVKGAEGYEIYRKTANGSYTLIKTVDDETTLKYTDSKISGGAKYKYIVKAYVGKYKGPASSAVSVTILGDAVISKAKNSVNNSVYLKWKEVEGATSYRIYRNTTGSSYKLIGTSKAAEFHDATAKKHNTKYSYKVQAVAKNAVGTTGCEKIGFRYIAAPVIKSAKANSAGKNVITWKSVSGATSYKVLRKAPDGKWKTVGTTSSLSFTDKTAKKGAKYYYTVRAVVNGVDGCFDNGKGVNCLDAPVLVSAKQSGKAVTVKWNAVSGAKGYIVYRKTSSGSLKKIGTVSGLSFSDTSSLKSGTKYVYTAKAYNSEGKSVIREIGVSVEYK